MDKNNYKDIINSEDSDKLYIESDSNSYEEKNKVNSVNINNRALIHFLEVTVYNSKYKLLLHYYFN